jgi:Uncharacterized protein conserved in archaea
VIELPEEVRFLFKDPFGTLYCGKGLDCVLNAKEEINEGEKLIVVGDVASYYIFKAGLSPDLFIIDGETKRGKASDEVKKIMKKEEYRSIKVKNPPATITKGIIDAIEMGLERKTQIFVEGEEDLAVLPAMILAPDASIIIYGQPDEGIVLIKVDEEMRNRAKDILKKMSDSELKNYLLGR